MKFINLEIYNSQLSIPMLFNIKDIFLFADIVRDLTEITNKNNPSEISEWFARVSTNNLIVFFLLRFTNIFYSLIISVSGI